MFAFLVASFTVRAVLAAQVTALGKQVYDLSHRELDLGWLGLVEFVPAVLLVVAAGSVADRFDRRTVTRLALAGTAVLSAVLAVLAGRSDTTVSRILAVVFLLGIASAFAFPAIRAMPANLVPLRQVPSVAALVGFAGQCGVIVGPIAAGFLYAADPSLPYSVGAGVLVVPIVALSIVRFDPTTVTRPLRPEADRGTLAEAVEGLRVIRRTPILLGSMTLDLFAVLFGGAVALLPVIADERLHVGAIGLGWLQAAGGIGATLVAGLLAWRPLRRHVGRVLLSVIAVFGGATIVLGVTRSYTVAFVAMFVLTGADAISMFIRNTLTPHVVPDELRGRVLAVEAVFIGASNELGAFESGAVGQLLGAPAAIVLGGVATLVVVATCSLAFPPLRRVDRFEDLEVATHSLDPH